MSAHDRGQLYSCDLNLGCIAMRHGEVRNDGLKLAAEWGIRRKIAHETFSECNEWLGWLGSQIRGVWEAPHLDEVEAKGRYLNKRGVSALKDRIGDALGWHKWY